MVNRKSADTPALRRLGREVARLRKLADMSQDQLGDACGLTGGMIGHIERAERSPTKRFVAKADEVLGANGHLLELWPDVVRSSYPEYAGDVLDAIPRATVMRDYHPLYVPGLVQTEAYAYLTLRAGNRFASEQYVASLVEGRMKLQRILIESDTPVVWEIVDEMALRRLASVPEVFYEQIDHLLRVSQSGRVQFQVIPWSVPLSRHPGLEPFTILSFAKEQDVAYVEGVISGNMITKPEEVERLSLKFGSLQGAALSTDQTIAFLDSLKGEHDGHIPTQLAQIELQQHRRRAVRGSSGDGDRPTSPAGSDGHDGADAG